MIASIFFISIFFSRASTLFCNKKKKNIIQGVYAFNNNSIIIKKKCSITIIVIGLCCVPQDFKNKKNYNSVLSKDYKRFLIKCECLI